MKRFFPAAIITAILGGLIAYAAPISADEMSSSEKRSVVQALADMLNANYVFPEKAEKASNEILKSLDEGEYDDIKDGAKFTQTLNKQVSAILDDAHFRVLHSQAVLPEREERSEPSPEEIEAVERQTTRRNAGVEKVELLPGNIGYMEMRGFSPAADAKRPVQAAMSFLEDTDAFILDLRRNGGGDPECVQLVCSFFFEADKPVHLNSLYYRAKDETKEYWTLPDLEGERYTDKPVYVLTSDRTGSAAEECSYNLKHLDRATIVGASTWGGANPGGIFKLNDHMRVFIPTGRAINPITKTNWEGVGVIPDVDVDPAEALVKAQQLALAELIEESDDEAWTKRLESYLARLDS
jgi:hypothetical protein